MRGLYAIADDGFAATPDALLGLIDAFLRGGARAVQLRCKRLGSRELLGLARAAAARCHGAGALLFVNDRVDLALLAGADGAHLGQDDLPLREARALAGSELLLGLSTHSDAEIDRALAEGADCLGFGPAFATRTKQATAPGAAALPPPHGLEGVRAAVQRARGRPLIAIGGIDEPRAEQLGRTGCACVAAISELCRAPDPEAKARALQAAFARGEAARRP